jgi:hypothetical protein
MCEAAEQAVGADDRAMASRLRARSSTAVFAACGRELVAERRSTMIAGQPFRLGGQQLWLTILVLLATTILLISLWWPVMSREYLEEVVLPGYEAEFGFKGGRVTVQEPGGRRYQIYAIVEVEPSGRLSRAGFRSGDAPIGHHGGSDQLWWVLCRARKGDSGTVQVRQASDWSTWGPIRELTVTPH